MGKLSKIVSLITKEGGLKKTVGKGVARILTDYNMIPKKYHRTDEIKKAYENMKHQMETTENRGIYFITAAHGFDEVFNQRTINFAKYLAQNGYMVAYIRWQFEYNDQDNRDFTQVYQNIFQIPLYPFLLNPSSVDIFQTLTTEKGFISTFPAKNTYEMFATIKEKGYALFYDIMDEWEEFYKEGQAPWYNRQVEEQYIAKSDCCVAVTKPLTEKFKHVKPIGVVGNGYSVEVSKHRDIACKKQKKDEKIHVGYFGHMTESWFDWDVIFKLAEKKEVEIHLVGHGMSDATLDKMKTYPNIHFYGKVHPSELHTYVREWHVGIIPFKPSVLSKAVDPIKIYEYVFFGLQTVSTGIPHIGEYPTVTHVEKSEEVTKTVQSLYEQIINGEEEETEREQFLKNTTWDERFASIIRLAKK